MSSSPYKAYLHDDGLSPRRSTYGPGADELRDLMGGADGRTSPSRGAAADVSRAAVAEASLAGSAFRSSDYVRPVASASAVPQSNSRAVISALKALQDKIRKLEQERAYYEENAQSLGREKDLIREQLAAERLAMQKAQAEQELLIRRQRAEMESSVTQTQSQLDRMRAELDEVNRRVRETEQAKARAERALNEAEQRSNDISRQAASESFQATQRLAELEQNQDRMRAETERRLREMQAAILEERSQRRAAMASDLKTKETLRHVLDVNESLVEKVVEGGDGDAAEQAAQAEMDNMMRERVRGASPRRPPSAKKKAVVAARRRSEATTERLSRPSASRAPRPRPRSAASSKTGSASGGGGGGGGRMPFVVGKNAGKSFSVTANVQQTLSMLSDLQPVVDELNASASDASGAPLYFTHADVDLVLSGLQAELAVYTDRYHAYKRELTNVQDDTPVEELNGYLRSTIEAMEAKGEQIRALKRYQRSVQRTLDTTHTQLDRCRRLLEEESRSKATPLKILRGIQQLQRQLRGEDAI